MNLNTHYNNEPPPGLRKPTEKKTKNKTGKSNFKTKNYKLHLSGPGGRHLTVERVFLFSNIRLIGCIKVAFTCLH